MEIKEIIETLRVCADDDIICPACPHYDSGVYGSGTADCYQNLMLKAADTIESQQKRIAELEAALREQEERRWIPVAERLPKCGERVLATDGGFVGEFYINKRGQWKRYNVNDYSLLMALDILFWMPLPEPPKGE